MKLTREGIKEREAWEKAGINLPGYDVEAVTEKAKKEPGWVHFGIGNIFRVFIGGHRRNGSPESADFRMNLHSHERNAKHSV